ncbi:hypothetical protein TBLA_0G01840 [Henningerozyma blattae CBS 6284]|uniref:Type 2A phosphatase-associated protein 42 n=1 Tax=Henningerozyma blattae (strain ATCC 34711 / CBS 6284 / DSM 70876 / NBRC 10599 / NRRL Y-10934 / UCD 77-7) TaxID=1071380 RepID=I2H6X5_HENB6|nr:hypothetical protein TBLA_0G01840 [Tetrapisispora blattae CBS 6284]CCH62127.1 hypothetical protein TBLA_0G01840 [Tetrapisispora blattae CBS 6284]
MSSQNENEPIGSIATQYEKIINQYNVEIKNSKLRQDSIEYQKQLSEIINKLITFKNLIYSKLSLFSDNETLDDLSTTSLKYLSIDYYLGLLMERKQDCSKNGEINTNKNKLKVKFLDKSIQLFIQFMITLQNYNILDELLGKKIDSFEETYHPKLEELYKGMTPKNDKDLSGAQLKREAKIKIFKRNKEINEKLNHLKQKYDDNKNENDEEKAYTVDEEEMLRSIYIEQLKSFSYDSFNKIEQDLYESELLNNFIKRGFEEITDTPKSNEQEDIRMQKRDFTGYTDKLEVLNKPLLSKQGKVLRNFTLTSKRQELKDKVKGYGQYGPTMTVEEFLEKEFEEGRVLQGGENEIEESQKYKEEMEDNDEYQDKETYKAREWDEFTEANPRGIGNTLNRG